MATLNEQSRSAYTIEIIPKWTNLLDRICNWPIRFDGFEDDPLDFIERVEELAEGFELSLDLLPQLMNLYLINDALTWFRYNRRAWTNWQNFKNDFYLFFLPLQNKTELEHTFLNHKQLPEQIFCEYLIGFQTLQRRLQTAQNLDIQRIYDGLTEEYKRNIKPNDFTTLPELIQLAKQHEQKTGKRHSEAWHKK